MNWIAPRTLPAIAVGDDVKEIFVVEVSLKSRDFDMKNINLLAKSIPQHIIYVRRYREDVRIAVYHSKPFLSNWQDVNSATLMLNGLNLDSVWENIVRQIGNIPDVGTSLCDVESTQPIPNPAQESLQQQIKASEDCDKLLRQIAALERQMNTTRQPRRKRELFIEIQKLKT